MERIQTAHLFAGLHDQLLNLLRGLSSADWDRPTVCSGWSVHDVASHILDTQVRIISRGVDRHAPPPSQFDDLVDFLNALNRDWVVALRRMSPRLLVEFLAITGPQVAAYVTSLDPDTPAPFPVAWAGETHSLNWFDTGRNYTEYWHHQQQIRDAVDAPPLTQREWLYPVLDIFLRALPHVYRETTPSGSILIQLTGEAGGDWTLEACPNWILRRGTAPAPAASISLPADSAWKLFTKGISPDQAKSLATIRGDAALAEPFFSTLAIMAYR